MANLRFVTTALLLFFSLKAGGKGEGEKILTATVIERQLLEKLSYDSICEQKYMLGFNHLVFIKAYVNYEGNTNLLLRELQTHIGNKLVEYRKSVAEFLNHIDNEINNLPLFPVFYLQTKLNVLIRKVYTSMQKPDFIPPAQEVDSKFQTLKVTLREIEAELDLENFTLDYLGDAKEQLKNHWNDEDFKQATDPFVKKLPQALVNIIQHLIIHYRPEGVSPEIEYLINFFNVFGSLIDVKEYHQWILELATKHLKTDKPTFQHDKHPPMFRTPKIFDTNGINLSIYSDIINTDKLFYIPNQKLYDVKTAIGIINPAYIYHPKWLDFFNHEDKTHPITITDPEERQKVIEDGFKNIYYVYVHARKENLLSLDPNVEKEVIADELYNFIIGNKCYANRLNPCDMEKLIPSPVFAKNYMVMLIFLKPLTSRPDDFDEEDVKKIVEVSMKLGIADLHKNVQNIAIDVPEFKKKVAVEKINNFEDSLKELTKPILQANKDQSEAKKKKLVMQTIHNNSNAIEKKFNAIYPEIQKRPDTPEEIQNFLDTAEVVVDKVYEDDNEVAKVLLKIIDAKVRLIDLEKLDETDSSLSRMFNILSKISNWVFIKIMRNPAVHPDNPFFKYLDYTITENMSRKSNRIKKPGYFSSDIHNEIRKRDLFVFYYQVKMRDLLDKEDAEDEIQELKDDLVRNEQMEIEIYEEDEYFIDFRHSFEFMIPFFNLFTLFETNDDIKGEKYRSKNTEFATIFDKLYTFLIDVRVNLESGEKQPLKFAYEKLLGCMTEVKNYILLGTKLSESTYELSEEEEQKDEEEQIEIKLQHRPCKQNYSTMSTYYYFLLVEAADHHLEVLQMHTKYFENLFEIRLDVLYQYLIVSENSFKNSFIRYCEKSEDPICLGEEIFRKIIEFMAKYNSRKDVEELLGEKVMTLSQMTKHGNNVPPSLFWEVMSTVAKALPSIGGNYSANRQTFRARKLVLSAEEEGQESEYLIDSMGNQHRDIFDKYIALRYHRNHHRKGDAFKMVSASVDYLITSTENIFAELQENEALSTAACKFLLYYSTNFEHVKKITDAMLQLKFLEDFLMWNDNKPVIDDDEFVKIAKEVDPKIGAKKIALFFKFKSFEQKPTKTAAKTTTTTKNPAPGNMKAALAAKMGGGKKPAPGKMIQQIKIEEERPGVGDTTELKNIVEREQLVKQLKKTMNDAGVETTIIITDSNSSEEMVLSDAIIKTETKKHLMVRRMRLLRRVLV